MFGLIKKIFDYNEKELSRLKKKVDEINSLEDKARSLKDSDFPKETKKMREEISHNISSLDEILPWSYALVREASRRINSQRHFDVQIMAAIALHEGKVVEQKTGEGKTLTATAPLYLNALMGNGTHLVTVNDYLARRDAGWMGAIFDFLGMKTSAIISDASYIYDPKYFDSNSKDWRMVHLRSASRREAYQADVTYGINSEFGFDYLRDNMSQAPEQLVQRGFHYAIIDEADSVLIDEARTPHIISAPYEEETSKYYQYAKIVENLRDEKDYKIDEKLRTANLTEDGVQNIEKMLGVSNIYEKDFDTLFHVEAALKAQTLFRIDKDYIVKEGEVIIVDEFTGRLLYGRRFSEGLHQAIEAKEKVPIQKESRTLATVSLQNYFRMYKKLAGMTGTAATEAEELNKIYKLETIVIPTHRNMVRNDFPDMIYKTVTGKYNAVAEEIAKNYKAGRPVLVGTTSIEKNELLSRMLTQKGVPHELLNAKNHEREAQIIAQAGKKGGVTVATNMAGRGVDIILGGETPDKYEFEKGKINKQYNKEMENWQKEHDKVVELGGLLVVGTERHESRRIDNQLRGRSGRQGDPGETRFFVSLEDDLMRIFGGEQITKLMNFFNFPEDQPLSHSMVSKAIEQAQVKVEGFNFDIRKHLVEFDDVLNKQREIVYSLRRKMLYLPEKEKVKVEEEMTEIFKEQILAIVNSYISLQQAYSEKDLEMFKKDLYFASEKAISEVPSYIKKGNFEKLQERLLEEMLKRFEKRKKEFTEKIWLDITRMIFLSTIDQFWTLHLTAIEDLREGINLRGYAQLDPLVEYKNEAYSMFERLIRDVYFEATRRLFMSEVEVSTPDDLRKQEEEKEKAAIFKSASAIDPFKPMEKNVTNIPTSSKYKSSTAVENEAKKKKIGRNDPCWCGSGKKYKKCHYPN